MTEEQKGVYEKRDFMLGEIHERTKRIPELEKSVNKLSRKVAVIEVKSGLFGAIGGAIFAAGIYIKHALHL